MKKTLLLLPLLALLCTSCEVEFSPNAEWREIPVAYCLLDQDDDTSFVRIQRCFMGEGDQRTYTTVPDSIYYPSDALQVFIEEWTCRYTSQGVAYRTGSAPQRYFQFQYAELSNKDSGQFANTLQPVYYCPTAGLLDTNCLYRLRVVKNNSTHDTLLSAETNLITGQMKLQRPNSLNKFRFNGTAGNKSCEFTWTTIAQARQYQPIVRFQYRDFIIDRSTTPWDTTIIPHYLDIQGPTVKSNMTDATNTTHMEETNYFLAIQQALQGDTCNKNYIDTVLVYITCCTEPLAAYLYARNPSGVINQEPFTYTNIEGGLGLFGARRTHLYFKVATPNSAADAYVKSLKALNVGF